MSETDFDPRRFRSSVPYYAKFRLGYPDLLIARVADRIGLRPGERVMDLGCGPGLLAIPLAIAGYAVTAVDPEPDMLAALGEAAREAGTNLDIRRGSSFDMPEDIGPFRLVAIGRAFHWMDRSAILRILDHCTAADGVVALFHDRHPRTAENRWHRVLHRISEAYGRAHSPHVRETESPDYRSHESILLDSPFSCVESIGVFVRRQLSADEIVGLAFSLSSSSPDKLGDRSAEFERELRDELTALASDGRFTEIAEMTAIVARRA